MIRMAVRYLQAGGERYRVNVTVRAISLRSRAAVCLQRIADYVQNISTERFADVSKLDHVKTTLVRLIFRYEGLRSPKRLRKLALRNACLTSKRAESTDQATVLGTEDAACSTAIARHASSRAPAF